MFTGIKNANRAGYYAGRSNTSYLANPHKKLILRAAWDMGHELGIKEVKDSLITWLQERHNKRQ